MSDCGSEPSGILAWTLASLAKDFYCRRFLTVSGESGPSRRSRPDWESTVRPAGYHYPKAPAEIPVSVAVLVNQATACVQYLHDGHVRRCMTVAV